MHTQNVYWDDSWFFLLAQFKCPDTGTVFAEGLSRVMLRHGRQTVDSRQLYELMGVHGLPDKDAVPAVVQQFLEWDRASEASMKGAEAANAETRAFVTRNALPSVLSAHSMNLPFQVPDVKQETV